MTAVARVGDKDSRRYTIVKGSPNVRANSLPISRVGDKFNHGNVILQGSPNVFVNGIKMARVGDKDSRPAVIANGSPNVFANNPSGGPSTASPIIPDKATLYSQLDAYVQPTVTRLEGAEQHDDDPNSDPNYTYYRVYSEQDAGLPPAPDTPLQTGTLPPPPPETLPADCGDIGTLPIPFADTFQLSPNFTLGMVSTQTLISNYIVQAQGNLTYREIVCNLRALCLNVLEPMFTVYGAAMVINSGFRIGSGSSQHYTGQAVDISFTDTLTTTDSFTRAQDIVNTFVYDQYIYEQNVSIWHHISYNQHADNRRQVLSKPRGSHYFPGLVRF